MEKRIGVTVRTKQHWNFSLLITKQKAKQIIDAQLGEKILLDDQKILIIHDNYMCWNKQLHSDQAKNDYLDKKSVKAELRKRIRDQAWSDTEN